MTVQTSYERGITNALPGLVADIGNIEVVSRSNKTAAGASILFGAVVGILAAGADNLQCVLGLGGGYLGIAARQTAKENTTINSETGEYLADETVNVFRSGKIWVTFANVGAINDVVKFNDTTGLISSGAPGAGETAIPNATLDSVVATIGDLGIVRIGV